MGHPNSFDRIAMTTLILCGLTNLGQCDEVASPKSPPAKESAANSSGQDSDELKLLVRTVKGEIDADDWQARAAAIAKLETLKPNSPAAIAALIELMGVKDQKVTVKPWSADVGFFAERALKAIGQPATSQLLKIGLHHKSSSVRQGSAVLLGAIQAAQRLRNSAKPDDGEKTTQLVVTALIKSLGDKYYGVAGASSTSLKKIGQPALLPLIALVNKKLDLRFDGVIDKTQPPSELALEIQQRNYAVGVLGNLNDARAIESILQALETDDEALRKWAGYAVSRLKSEACRVEFNRPANVKRLIATFKRDGQPLHGVKTVLRKSSGESVDLLVAALDDPDRRLRIALLDIFSYELDDPRVVPALLKSIAAPAEDTAAQLEPMAVRERWMVLQTLSRYLKHVDSADTISPTVLNQLKHPAAEVRTYAAYVIQAANQRWANDKRYVLPMIEAMQGERIKATQIALVRVLGELNDRRAVDILVFFLAKQEAEKKKNTDLCARLCEALGQLGDRRALPALRQRLPLDEPFVLEAIGKIGDVDAVPVLIKQLTEGTQENPLAACKALRSNPDARATDALLEVLDETVSGTFTRDDIKFVQGISEALAATKSPEAAEALIKSCRRKLTVDDQFDAGWEPSLEEGVQQDRRFWAIAEIGRVALPALIDEIRFQRKKQATRKPGQFDFQWSREICVAVIARLATSQLGQDWDRTAELETLLLGELECDVDGVQLHAIRSLGYLQSTKSAQAILQLLETPFGAERQEILKQNPKHKGVHHEVRVAALTSLNSLRIKSAETFAKHLTHRVSEVRKQAVLGLKATKHPETASLLTQCLQDKSGPVRAAAAEQLGQLGDKQCIAALIQLIANEQQPPQPQPMPRFQLLQIARPEPPADVIAKAVQSLGLLEAVQSIDLLFELTKNSDKAIRANSIVALVQLRDSRGVDLLCKALQKEPAPSRVLLIKQSALLVDLIKHADDKSLEPLTSTLCNLASDDKYQHAKLTAIGVVASIGNDQAIVCLQAACKDRDAFVRSSALSALLSTSSPKRFDVLRSFLDDEAPRCRIWAVQAYGRPFANPTQKGVPSAAKSIKAVAPLLDDLNPHIRQEVLRVIGKLASYNPAAAIEHQKSILRLARSDVEAAVRSAAQLTLKRIKQSKRR